MTSEKIVKVLEDIDNYEQSLHALLAMLHLYKFDDSTRKNDSDVKGWFGKKMQPGDITPDLCVQIGQERGVVTELKRSLPRNNSSEDYWQEEFEQIKKYDSDLQGWQTENKKIRDQDLVLLTSQKVVIPAIDYITQKNLKFTSFSKKFSVWSFNPAGGTKPAVFLQKRSGEITNFKNVTNERLREGVPIAKDYLKSSGLLKVKFVDDKPNIIYLMSILWDFIFGTIPTEEDWREASESGGKIVQIDVSVDSIKKILNKNYTLNGDVTVVKNEWIKEALDKFVFLKFAKKNKYVDSYTIKYRKKIKDEEVGEDKHKVFAELLYKEGVQTEIADHLTEEN